MRRTICAFALLFILTLSLIDFTENAGSIASAAQQQGLTVSINNLTVTEGTDAEAVFTVTLKYNGFREFTSFITYEPVNVTATAFQDFQPRGGTLTFPPGETPSEGVTMQIAFPIVDDGEVEEDETFQVFIADALSQATVMGPGTCTIQDNDSTTPILSILDTEVTEGDSGTADAVFSVRMNRQTDVDVRVDYTTENFGAVAGRDYTAISGTLTFPAGSTRMEIRVPIIGDTLPERTQGFFVRLSNAIEAVILGEEGVCSIRDNDAPEKVKACSESDKIEIDSDIIVEDMEIGIFISGFRSRQTDGLAGFSIKSPATFGAFTSHVLKATSPISIGTTCSDPVTEFPDCVFTNDSSTSFDDGFAPYKGRWQFRNLIREEGKRASKGNWSLEINASQDSFCWCIEITGPREGLRLDPSNAVIPIFAIIFPDDEEESGFISFVRTHEVRASLHSNGVPAARVPVTFEVHDAGDNVILTRVINTDETGRAVFEYADYIPGNYTIEARAEVGGAIYTDIARVTWVNPCAATQSLQGAPNAEARLAELRKFRDSRLARSKRGQEYTRLYYKLSTEAVQLMALNPMLIVRSRDIMQRYLPVARDMAKGKDVTLTEGDLNEIDGFLNYLASKGSRELKEEIRGLCEDLRDSGIQKEFGITVLPGPKREITAGNPLLSGDHIGIGVLLTGICSALIFGFTGKRRRFIKRHTKQMLVVILAMAMVSLQTVVDGRQSAGGDQNARAISGLSPLISKQAGQNETFGNMPVRFEANHGQADSQIRFISRGAGYNLFLKPNEAMMSLSRQKAKGNKQKGNHQQLTADHRPPTTEPATASITDDGQRTTDTVSMKLLGANPHPAITGLDELPMKTNYFIGKNRSKWREDVPSYSKVKYDEVYEGVDLLYYGNQRQIEYDFIVAPGADPRQIELGFEGAGRIEVDWQGDLVLHTAGGEVRHRKPLIYQEVNGIKHTISGRYRIRNPQSAIRNQAVGFELDDYDRSLPLVIDPVLAYSTYLGGSGDDQGTSITVDSEGSVYIVGLTDSLDFPTSDAAQPQIAGTQDAFVAKLDPSGGRLIYVTYLGGEGAEGAGGVALDSSGNLYVAGFTTSTDFPVMNAFQPSKNGEADAFVTKFSPTGNLLYSTYLGGSSRDFGTSIAVDQSGNMLMAGVATSPDFPAVNEAQGRLSGAADVFVAKLNPAGDQLLYSTYLGGTDNDGAASLALDPSGNAYVTGLTFSFDFMTANPVQLTPGGGAFDAFVAKIAPAGALVYSTYLGGRGADRGLRIIADAEGNAYVTGDTDSENFPTINALQTALRGSSDAFLVKLNPDGSRFVYSTYLGGSDTDGGMGIARDSTGSVYLTGFTSSSDFPILAPVQTTEVGGTYDVFAAKVNTAGTTLESSTYIGGTGLDSGIAVATDGMRNVYVMGLTDSSDFPSRNGFQAGNGGGASDLFIARLGDGPVITGVTIKRAKHVIITGEEFEPGAVILLNGEEQKTKFKSATSLKGKKVARNIAPGDTVRLQVRNPDGATSAEFIYTRTN